MAMFRFNIEAVKRSRGQQATGAAAYCAGETIRDKRTGKVHDHSERRDVRHTEILLPSQFGDASMEWARNRSSLWNTAEEAEKRKDARVAREYQLSLPPELKPEQRLTLARTFARELADRYGVAVDLAIHDPKPDRDTPNFHAHLLTTTREVTSTGLGAKTGLDLGAVPRAKQGLAPHAEEYSTLRERWATLTNEAFQSANIATRVDHRSLAAQGIARPPVLHIPAEFYQLERQGMPKEQAERLRAEYRARIAAHRERSAGASRGEQAALQPAGPGKWATPQTALLQGAGPSEPTSSQAAAHGKTSAIQPERAASKTSEATVPTAPEVSLPAGRSAMASAAREATVSPGRGATTSAGREATVSPGRGATASASREATVPAAREARAPASHDASTPTGPAHKQAAQADPKDLTPPAARELTPRNPEETRRRAVQAWLEMRSKEAESSQSQSHANEASIKRGREEGQER